MSVVIPEHIPFLVRKLGAKFKDGPREYRMRWGELAFRRRGVALDLCMFDSHFSLHVHALWTSVYVTLPFLQRWHRDPYEIMESWGFSLGPEMGLHLHWGRKTKIIYMPWRNWVQTAHDVRCVDGSWAPWVGSWEHEKEPDGRALETHPYRYILRSGEVQDRTATIYVERRVRKLKWLRWLPFGRTAYAIDVRFNDEVGERSGSWKGGCIGCGYTLRENETPLECLRRMERERKF